MSTTDHDTRDTTADTSRATTPGTAPSTGRVDPPDTLVRLLSEEECWELLEDHELGRIGYRLVDEVHVVPVNYAVVDRTLLIRTDAGNKLLAAALESDVALEIDSVESLADARRVAWSVLVRGHARVLGEDEARRYDDLPLVPWVATPKWEVVAIVPEAVTGRRFQLVPA
ncbi:pyridoxamine 5'-phosphate oxidase family protein [Nocardioides marinus]|uniref:Nitroimidazol reductase NimA, pyridoxamine 5'-phosphate oxidase superfamily n=1 Tax=Nocardioides marinus TaxID=374514 RepID=A0A7Y9YGY7_9ACTN|nr:pyridoxamine 5'-phosphate oxidase family protein [Nocardioides marinus]NYI11998.1 hypothetical protein [Nocardioides marinus]